MARRSVASSLSVGRPRFLIAPDGPADDGDVSMPRRRRAGWIGRGERRLRRSDQPSRYVRPEVHVEWHTTGRVVGHLDQRARETGAGGELAGQRTRDAVRAEYLVGTVRQV